MRYYVFGAILFCLCVLGSTKSSHAFDFSNSTVIQAEEVSSRQPASVSLTKGQTMERVSPPQPRNKGGRLVCTSNRYVEGEQQIGKVSWYGVEFHGQKTRSGEVFDQNAYTLAHLTLPMGTEVLVQNPDTGATAHAHVNDCGPFVTGRIADLSYGLAKELGLTNTGKAQAIIIVL
jgi:rare lipoprotein A